MDNAVARLRSAPGKVRTARVLRRVSIGVGHFRTVFHLPHSFDCGPGQFVQLQCGPGGGPSTPVARQWTARAPLAEVGEEWRESIPLLRRPFSIAAIRRRADGVEADVIYKVFGAGTRWLSRQQPGAVTTIIGPLGSTFPVDPARSGALLVGGGVGLAPLMLLSKHLAAAQKRCVLVAGARSADQFPATVTGRPDDRGAPASCLAEFSEHGVPAVVTTDDGSLGTRGVVTAGMRGVFDAGHLDPADTVVYACGPQVMMRAVAELAGQYGVPCKVCLERVMACGMGTCQSCVVSVRDADARPGRRFKLCCTDGPVFDSNEVIWDEES